MKRLLSMALAGGLAAGPAAAEIVQVASERDVAATMDALESAVIEAGASIFARIDHAAGAAGVGMTLASSQLLVFGNPKLGTPAMQDAMLAGLELPLRVLVYEDGEGAVWLAYEEPVAMLVEVGVSPDAEYLGKMAGALSGLTAKAAGN